MTGTGSAAEEFWEPHYASSSPGTPGPNPALVDVVAQLPPGQVLDLGCGGGGDALWLARQGWTVLTVDVSATALARVADRAAAAAVRPGGMLLIVDHASVPPWSWADPDTVFPTPRRTMDGIGLHPEQWDIVRLENHDRVADGPDAQHATVTDTVIAVVRGPAAS